MMRLNALVLSALVALQGHAMVRAEMNTQYLASNGYNFTCTVLKKGTTEDANAHQKNIMLLHGFPYNREFWHPLLEQWDQKMDSMAVTSKNGDDNMPTSLHAVACDLRGYSPGASPDDVGEYTTEKFADDVYGLAEAAGFETGFHLIGHDHGAGLGWFMAANDPDNQVLSYVSLSAPHLQLLSDALCSDNPDEAQVIAGNYFNQFSVPDAAYVNDGALYRSYKVYFGLGDVEQATFQRWLYWYKAMEKLIALPRVVSDEEVEAFDGEFSRLFLNVVRSAIPLDERQCEPVGKIPVGAVEVPTLMICGLNDPVILCNRPYASDYPPDLLPNYEHVNFQCGHSFFDKNDCESEEETQAVMDKITSFVLGSPEKDANMEGGGTPQVTESSSASRATVVVSAFASAAAALLAW